MVKTAFLLVVCAATLGGCDSGLDEVITIVNESPEPLRFEATTLDPGGDTYRYHVLGCTDGQPLSFVTEAGEEYARLGVEYCPGQRWTITGPGEIVLTQD